jgi:N-acetylglucosaminyldiphosphoundecaprenol N-acetyl-beta-D-mannosaminyltransferase
MPTDLAQDTFRLLTTDLLATDYASLIRLLESRALQAGAFAVDFCDTQLVALRRRDQAFANLTSCFDLFVPKAMTLLWGMKRLGADMRSPIDPPILMRRLLSQSPPDFRHYFIGESEECNNRLRERMLTQNPDIDLVGSLHATCSASGYLQPPELHDFVLDDLRAKEPHFVWVGIDGGAAYALVANLKRKLRSGILLAMGSAFDVNAGIRREVPSFMQRHRLAWLYHLSTQPTHFLGTSARYNALFLYHLFRESESVS